SGLSTGGPPDCLAGLTVGVSIGESVQVLLHSGLVAICVWARRDLGFGSGAALSSPSQEGSPAMSNATLPSSMPFGDPYAGVPPLGQRVGQGVLVWLAFVVPVGLATMPPNSGVIGVISGLIAGCIVLLPIGAILGAIG